MGGDPRDDHFDYIEFITTSPAELAATRDFFSHIFGWTYRAWGEGYADTRDSGIVSGIAVEPGGPPIPLPTLYTSDLEALRERVRRAGGQITREIFAFPGGRRFHFREPSGTELAAWTETDE